MYVLLTVSWFNDLSLVHSVHMCPERASVGTEVKVQDTGVGEWVGVRPYPITCDDTMCESVCCGLFALESRLYIRHEQ